MELIAVILIVVAAVFVGRHVRDLAKGRYRDAEGTERPWWIVGNGRKGGI
ncbi:MAG: hypothetical protein R3249_12030 [Nitriliruptorales bacterium]|nr:hypothetical protein [Nitriliruptorales bacterium]